MTDLPPGWAEATLGDLLLGVEAGKSFRCEPRPAGSDEWGIIKVSAMTWGEFRETENKAVRPDIEIDDANEIKSGDILLSRANTESYVGASVLVKNCRPRLLLSDKSLRLVPSPSVDRRWFSCLLGSPGIRRDISRRATGTKDSMRNISQSSLKEIGVLVPPLSEQRRIVAALEGHLSLLDNAQRAAEKARLRLVKLRESVLRDCFYRLLADSKSVQRLASVATIASGQTPKGISELVQQVPSINSVPYYKVGDMNLSNDHFMHESRTYVLREDAAQLGLHVRPAGTVLIPKRGGAIHTNKKRITKTPAAYDLNTMGIIPGETLVVKYLWYWLEGINLSALCDGSNVPQINNPHLVDLEIPVPSLDRQREVVAALDIEMAGINRLAGIRLTTESKLLRRSLLAEAFAGRLVEQDPADEPASVLLERIRAERAAQGPVRRARRSKGEKAPQKETLL
ncbi:restriction endonuclease subunit S [Actinomadura chokoriensis]|uniref:Restriction endonuclease subunit S n=1 Tax=Actinomadura chokoriensis TaxID=454156 RepID=A0ABV4R3T0_9ACTN